MGLGGGWGWVAPPIATVVAHAGVDVDVAAVPVTAADPGSSDRGESVPASRSQP